jgi:hypothetical protein
MYDINIQTKDGSAHNMTLESYARWLCLAEAFDYIDKSIERRKGRDKDIESAIKPIAIQKYIDERYHAMLHDVKVEEHVYDIETFVTKTLKSTSPEHADL